MQADLRGFCKMLNPGLAEHPDLDVWENKPKRRCLLHFLIALVLPAGVPFATARFLMDWPTGFTYSWHNNTVESKSLIVEEDHVIIDRDTVRTQIFLSVLFVIRLVLVCMCCGRTCKRMRSRMTYGAMAKVEGNLKTLRLADNSAYYSTTWSFYAIVGALVALSFWEVGPKGVSVGLVIGLAAGLLYLKVANSLGMLLAGGVWDGPNVIAAYDATFALSHKGLWTRLDQWDESTFGATSQQLLSMVAHKVLCASTKQKWKDRIDSRLIERVKTDEDACQYIYGEENVIEKIWVVDESRLIDLRTAPVDGGAGWNRPAEAA